MLCKQSPNYCTNPNPYPHTEGTLDKCKLAIGAVGPLLFCYEGSGPVTVFVSRNGRASGQRVRESAGPAAKSSLGLTPPTGGPAAPPSQFKDLFLGREKENALIPLTKKKFKKKQKVRACLRLQCRSLAGRPTRTSQGVFNPVSTSSREHSVPMT